MKTITTSTMRTKPVRVRIKSNRRRSIFAKALFELLDKTTFCQNRRQWAELLGVSTAAISQWVNDKTIPRADHLFLIYNSVKSGPQQDVVRAFYEVAQMQASEVSPSGKRMLPTVWEYMNRQAFGQVAEDLAKLSEADQERYLEKVYGSHPRNKRFEETGSFSEARVRSPFDKAEKDQVSILARRLLFLNEEQQQSFDAFDAFNRFPKLFIVGSVGIGKTTLLHTLAKLLASRASRLRTTPFYISAPELLRPALSDNLASFVSKSIALDSGSSLTLLIDSFDQVPLDDRNPFVAALSKYFSDNASVRFVGAGRPVSHSWHVHSSTVCYLEELSDIDVFRAVSSCGLTSEQYYGRAASEFIIRLAERPQMCAVLRNPLFLSLAKSQFFLNGLTPDFSTDILSKCVSFVTDEWNQNRCVEGPKEKWARPQLLQRLLSNLCYHSLVESKTEFTSDEASNWTRELVSDVPIERVLSTIAELTSLVSQASNSMWKLHQKTLREFLAARYILDSAKEFKALFSPHLSDVVMQNVLRYALGMASDPSEILSFVLRELKLEDSKRVFLLADLLSEKISSECPYVPEAAAYVIHWLDNFFSDFVVCPNVNEESESRDEPRWRLMIRADRSRHALSDPIGTEARKAIESLHRARVSPTKVRIVEELKGAKSEFLRRLPESMNVEGRYSDRVKNEGNQEFLTARVGFMDN